MDCLIGIAVLLFLQGTHGLGAPSYVSDWEWMDVNDVSTTYKTLTHTFGVRPAKGDVQVQSSVTGFIYPGVKNAQNDNDNSYRGGVILVYDETEARIIGATNDNNNNANAYIIYTGETTWTTGNDEALTQAWVRVRLWHPDDLPVPSAAISTMMAAEQINGYPNYLELPHNLSSVPALTIVQYYSTSTISGFKQLVAEGQGSSQVQTHGRSTSSLQESAFVFAVNDSYIRLWAFNAQSGVSYNIFSFCDGWGYHTFDSCSFRTAYVDIKFYADLQTVNLYSADAGRDVSDTSTLDVNTVVFDLISDLVIVTVRPTNGVNEGFEFDGTGAAMTDGIENSAGLIYAYNETGIVRLWHPTSPYCIIQVGPAMGEDTNNQCAQDVVVTVSIWRGVNCTAVPVENAVYTKTSAAISYECELGSVHVSGNLQRTCQLNNTYTGTLPVCKKCEPIDTGTLTHLDIELLRTENVANFTCVDGYTHLSGNLTRYCEQPNADWSGDPPICGVVCEALDTGTLAILDSELFRTQNIANFTCMSGYTHLSGNLTRYCEQPNGTWSGEPPACGVVCNALEPVTNAMIDVELFRTQNIANFTCMTGYTHLSGNLTRYCEQPNGTWSGQPPVCGDSGMYIRCTSSLMIPMSYLCLTGRMSLISVVCDTLDTGPYAILDSELFKTENIANFTCMSGYTHLSGNLTRYCEQPNGTWSGQLPACGVVCEALEARTYATIDLELFRTQNVANFTCMTGYTHLSGNLTRYCEQPNGTWSGQPPICGVACEALDTGTYATIDLELYRTQNIANLTCMPGYTHLSGNLTRYCELSNGTWSGEPPVCGVVCDALEPVTNAMIDVELFRTENIANLTCMTGYTHLSGNLTRYCEQPNGTWSGEPPVCGVVCEALDTGTYATIDLELLRTQNIANFTCMTGYTHLSGNLTRYCEQPNGTWSGEPPVCGVVTTTPVTTTTTTQAAISGSTTSSTTSPATSSTAVPVTTTIASIIITASSTTAQTSSTVSSVPAPGPPTSTTNTPANQVCYNVTTYYDLAELEEQTQQIVANLTVDAKSTSKYTRSKTSMDDGRPTSMYIGVTGSLIFGLVAGFFLVPDIINVARFLCRHLFMNE